MITAFDCAFNEQRRRLLGSMIGAAGICLLKIEYALGQSGNAQVTVLTERYGNLLQSLVSDPELLKTARGQGERRILAMNLGLEILGASVDRRTPPSSTLISQRSTDLIIQVEVSDENYYNKFCKRPTWPEEQSGVTVGIGYDIGYVTKDFLKEDWQEFVEGDVIEKLSVACGKKKESAKELIDSLRDIEITWAAAVSQYLKKTQPLYVGETEANLPNTKLLSPDSLGALVSLVYNRGASFNSSGDRYEEMRNIKMHMADKEFDKIPDELRSMTRLWPGTGLVKRREAEAALFELGLAST